MQVVVKFNNVDFALRHLKRKVQKEGIPHMLRLKRYYLKPSEEIKVRRRGGAGMYGRYRHRLGANNAASNNKISSLISSISQLGANSPVESSRDSIESVISKSAPPSHESIVVRDAAAQKTHAAEIKENSEK